MAEERVLHNKEPGQRHKPRVMASAPSVVEQARLMDSAGTAWHAVKYGNLEMITKLFPNSSNVYARGPVGENVLHMAMLLNTPSTLAIARFLIKLYGRTLINCPFQERKTQHDPPGAYEGETALHIAIINKDFDMVKFLVQNGADIRARAWGPFFGPEGPMYYGEYPLSLAACTGQKDVVAYLKRHGARVNTDHDVYGNPALHLCVVHGQQEMYDFLVEYCAASDRVVNLHGHTPLVLAAVLGKVNMVQHIYNKRRRAFYTFGRVTSYSLSLREIDTVQDEEEYVPNVLEAVVRKGHTELLEEPLVSTLLRFKWVAFARWHFLAHFMGYLVLELSQTFLIWLHSTRDHWNMPSRASQEYVGLSLAVIMAGIEVLDYVTWSREAYHRRLVMSSPPHYAPPLYAIPGESRDGNGVRGGLFARISARMGFPGGSGSSGDMLRSSADQGSGHKGASLDGVAQARPSEDRRNFAERIGFVKSGQPPRSAGGPQQTGQAGSSAAAPSPFATSATTAAAAAAAGMPAAGAAGGSAADVSGGGTWRGNASPLWHGTSDAALQPLGAVASGTSTVGGLRLQQRSVRQQGRPEGTAGPMGEGVEGSGSRRFEGAVGSMGSGAEGPAWRQQGRPLGEATEPPSVSWANGTRADADGNPAAAGAGGAGASGSGAGGDAADGGAFAAAMAAGHGIPQDDDDESDFVSVGVSERRLGTIRSFADLQSLRHPTTANTNLPRLNSRGRDVSREISADSSGAGSSTVGSSFATIGSTIGSGPRASLPAGSYPPASSLRPGVLNPDDGVTGGVTGSGGSFAGPSGRSGPSMSTVPVVAGGGPRLSAKSVSFPPTGPAGAGDFEERAAAALGLDRSWTGGSTPTGGLGAGGLASAGPSGVVPGSRQQSFSAAAGGSHRGVGRVSSFNAGRAAGASGLGGLLVGDGAPGGSEAGTPGAGASPSTFSPANKTEQLERQRTRARNGGGDLPTGMSALMRKDTLKRGGGGALPTDSGYRKPSPAELERAQSTKQEPDVELGTSGASAPPPEAPHRTHSRAFFETTREGFARMLEDPWLFIWHLHLVLTFVHFITWRAAYGGEYGPGPSSLRVKEFDDVIVSLMGLTGWLAVIYFFRGIEPTGKLAVILERMLVDVLKFISLFFLWDIGFTLAFYTMQKGTLWVTNTPQDDDYYRNPDEGPFKSIPYGLISLISFAVGTPDYEGYCNLGWTTSEVFCTIYFLLYIATVVLLLLYLLIAMIIRTYDTCQSIAYKQWRRRWAMYVLKAERRMPKAWVLKHRLGQLAWDPKTNRPAYSHVFEAVDEDKDKEAEEKTLRDTVKLAEQLLESLKKKQ